MSERGRIMSGFRFFKRPFLLRGLAWMLAGYVTVAGGCEGSVRHVGTDGSEIVVPSFKSPSEIIALDVRLSSDGSTLSVHYRLSPGAAMVWPRSQITITDERTGRVLPLETPSPAGSDYLMPNAGSEGVLIFKNDRGVVKTGSSVIVRLGSLRMRRTVGVEEKTMATPGEGYLGG